MNNMIAKMTKAGMIGVALLISAGCQSTKALDEVRAMAQKADQDAAAAQTTANSADASAKAANSTAESAKSAADNAQNTANRALQAAQTAQTGVDAVNEKIDRMFKKSVSK